MLIKLTEKKALEICLELWEWVAKTRGRDKRVWPGWKKYGRMEASCPLCELRDQKQEKHVGNVLFIGGIGRN